MPQLNTNLLDAHLINCFLFLFAVDVLSVLQDMDDDLLTYNANVLLLATLPTLMVKEAIISNLYFEVNSASLF